MQSKCHPHLTCRSISRIANFYLPPGSYFEDTILSLLDRSKNTLRWLQISNCGLSKDNMKEVLDFVSKNESLHSLDLSNNVFDVEIATLLSSSIKNHPILYKVDLEKSDLGNGDLGVLNKLLYACKDIDELLLGHNNAFDNNCIDLLSKFLGKSMISSGNPKHRSITIYLCSRNCLFRFVLLIGKKISLTILSLDGPKLGSKSKKVLARGLKKNKSLRDLRLHNNGLKFEEIFAGDARSLRRLTCLDFSGNSFPTSGAQVLADYLSDNTTLQSLVISQCRLRTEAAKVFLPELERNTTLGFLNL